MIRAVVVDDEPLMRRSILRLLQAHPGVTVEAECGDGASAVSSILELAPDVVFLDMLIPGFRGLEVIQKIGPTAMPLTVFVTAYAGYAVQAFEARAVDYLLKPFGQRRFDEAMSRVKERLAAPKLKKGMVKESWLEWIPVTVGGRACPVKVSDVDWMEAEKNHVLLHMGAKVAVVRRTLHSLAQSLDPLKFVRIHRSTIVNVDKIREIHPWCNGYHRVVLTCGPELRMSRYQHESVRLLLGKSK